MSPKITAGSIQKQRDWRREQLLAVALELALESPTDAEISMALGLHGQFIFSDRSSRTVIVKLSDNPTGSDNEVATAEVLHFISQLKK
jgi:hypothetical protein